MKKRNLVLKSFFLKKKRRKYWKEKNIMKQYQIQEKQHHREQSERVRKAEEETENFRVKKVDPSFAQQLIQYRMSKGWKRQDLARFLCLKVQVIDELETGRAIQDGQLIHKIKQKLKM